MKLENKTDWNTADLRRIIYRAFRDELLRDTRPDRIRATTMGKTRLARVTVTVTYRRGSGQGVSGLASIGGTWARLYVPRPARKWGAGLFHKSLAQTATHEAAHVRGLRHKAMKGTWLYSGPIPDHAFPWAIGPLRVNPPKAPADPITRLEARRMARLADLEKKVATWTRKMKLAKGKLQKYTRALKRTRMVVAPAEDLAAKSGTRPGPPLELCATCDQPTGRAGAGDGSLFLMDGSGPYCPDCYGAKGGWTEEEPSGDGK